MGGKTLTRADLAEAVYRKVGLSRSESASLVEMIIDEISDAVVRGETVKLSSFATFQVATSPSVSVAIRRPARKCRFRRAA
jgi:integration host factor subunit alpha